MTSSWFCDIWRCVCGCWVNPWIVCNMPAIRNIHGWPFQMRLCQQLSSLIFVEVYVDHCYTCLSTIAQHAMHSPDADSMLQSQFRNVRWMVLEQQHPISDMFGGSVLEILNTLMRHGSAHCILKSMGPESPNSWQCRSATCIKNCVYYPELLRPVQVRACFPDILVEEDGAIFSGHGFSKKFTIPDSAQCLRQSALMADCFRLFALRKMTQMQNLPEKLGEFDANKMWTLNS